MNYNHLTSFLQDIFEEHWPFLAYLAFYFIWVVPEQLKDKREHKQLLKDIENIGL